MKGVNTWSFAPYKPFLFDTGDIYVCRLYPGAGTIGLDWLPLAGADPYTVVWKKRGAYCWEGSASVQGTSYVIEKLEDLAEYELQVLRQDKKSRVRLAKTGAVPGDVVVNYLHPEDDAYSFSGRYLCSPSLVRLPDGGLLASMDLFAGGAPQDLSLIYVLTTTEKHGNMCPSCSPASGARCSYTKMRCICWRSARNTATF